MANPPWLVVDGAPFGGRSVVVGRKGAHLWGASASPTADPADYLPFVAGAQLIDACPGPGGLYQITTAVREYQRVVEEGTVLPLSDQAYSNPPAGTDPPTPRTQVQLRVVASDGSGIRQFDMDANQSLTIVAQDVCLSWLAPISTVDVMNWTDAQRATVARSGFVFDAFLNVAISRIEASPGDNSSAVLTTHLYAGAGLSPSIMIPAYATEVTIYQASTIGAASVSWTQHYGDPNGVAGSMELGALPFLPGLRKTQPFILLPNATHLQADTDPAGERWFTLRWTIRP